MVDASIVHSTHRHRAGQKQELAEALTLKCPLRCPLLHTGRKARSTSYLPITEDKRAWRLPTQAVTFKNKAFNGSWEFADFRSKRLNSNHFWLAFKRDISEFQSVGHACAVILTKNSDCEANRSIPTPTGIEQLSSPNN
jgi:hypothetical protein